MRVKSSHDRERRKWNDSSGYLLLSKGESIYSNFYSIKVHFHGSLHGLCKTIENGIDAYVIVADRSTDVSETLLDRCIFLTGVTDD